MTVRLRLLPASAFLAMVFLKAVEAGWIWTVIG
jgi:hypothetical protein